MKLFIKYNKIVGVGIRENPWHKLVNWSLNQLGSICIISERHEIIPLVTFSLVKDISDRIMTTLIL